MVKARQRESSEASKRELIFESALTLFRQKGFDATTIRDIATHAGVAVGSTHYHFGSKEELVFHFFRNLLVRQQERGKQISAESRSFSTRIHRYFEFVVSQLESDRQIVCALSRVAADPASSVSPLGWQTTAIRDEAVALLSELVDGSDLKVHRLLRPLMGKLLWLIMMGNIFFWSHDRTRNQRCSRAIMSATLTLTPSLLRLTTAPLATRYVKLAVEIVERSFEAFSFRELEGE